MPVTPEQNDISKNLVIDEKDTRELVSEVIEIIRENIFPIILFFIVSLIITLSYIYTSENIYRSTTLLKVENQNQTNIFENSLVSEFSPKSLNNINDQILFLKSFSFRDRVAKVISDSLFHATPTITLSLLIHNQEELKTKPRFKSKDEIRSLLQLMDIKQKDELNALEISAEGPQFNELSFITNLYALEYLNYLNEESKQDLTNLKGFLKDEIVKKTDELREVEDEIQSFLAANNIVDVNSYFENLFSRINNLDEILGEINLEVISTRRNLDSLNSFLQTTSDETIQGIEAELNKTTLVEIQKQLNALKIQRDLDLILAEDGVIRENLRKKYDPKIELLTTLRQNQFKAFIGNLKSDTPISKDKLIVDIIEKRNALDLALLRKNFFKAKYDSLSNKLDSYQHIQVNYTDMMRKKMSIEKLFSLLEEKYQETKILERTRIGNGYILDSGEENQSPIKPNKSKILFYGIFLGLFLGFAFAFLRSFFDKSIKSPEVLEKKGVSLLAWIPSLKSTGEFSRKDLDLMVLKNPKANASESFKALRTRIHFARLDSENFKTILVTSSIPSEGKTTVAVNLAASFAQTTKKTLLIDCDLRKPRIHEVFGTKKDPGLTDYLFGSVTLEAIEHSTEEPNLTFITSGTIPPNPSEILGSKEMKNFLELLKSRYDLILIDSPPYVAVTDSEILFNLTDGTVMVAKADHTPLDLLMKSYTQLYLTDHKKLLGAVLNNFSAKAGYGSYYSYYYYYAKSDKK